MPIKGLSEERRLPRAGKIRLGVKKTSSRGNPYPSATDYFVVIADQSTSPAAAGAFHAAYGEAPRSLDIFIPNQSEDLEALKEIVFPQYYKQYGSGTGLKCKGDGQAAERMEVDTSTGAMDWKKIVCVGPDTCPYVKRMSDGSGGTKGDCGPVAHLQVLLPKVQYLGVWQIDTGSVMSIKQINSDLALIHMAAGRISNIPLKLNLVPRQVAPGGKKKTVYTLSIAYEGSIQQLRLLKPTQGAFLMDMIDDEEVPTDLRPIEALQPHPLAGHLPSANLAAAAKPPTLPAPAAPAPSSPPARSAPAAAPEPGRLTHYEEAFGDSAPIDDTEPAITETAPKTYDLNAPPPVATGDPVEDAILFNGWRIGMAKDVLDTTRQFHKGPERLLSALQKTPTPPSRVAQLFDLGFKHDGFPLEEAGS